jgi:hypothetical protein
MLNEVGSVPPCWTTSNRLHAHRYGSLRLRRVLLRVEHVVLTKIGFKPPLMGGERRPFGARRSDGNCGNDLAELSFPVLW